MRFPFDWLTQLLTSAILLWGIGSMIASTLMPRTFRRDIWLVAPFLGFGTIAGIGSYLGSLGISTNKFAWILLVAGVIGLLAWRCCHLCNWAT
jgi:hypothetical protein